MSFLVKILGEYPTLYGWVKAGNYVTSKCIRAMKRRSNISASKVHRACTRRVSPAPAATST